MVLKAHQAATRARAAKVEAALARAATRVLRAVSSRQARAAAEGKEVETLAEEMVAVVEAGTEMTAAPVGAASIAAAAAAAAD